MKVDTVCQNNGTTPTLFPTVYIYIAQIFGFTARARLIPFSLSIQFYIYQELFSPLLSIQNKTRSAKVINFQNLLCTDRPIRSLSTNSSSSFILITLAHKSSERPGKWEACCPRNIPRVPAEGVVSIHCPRFPETRS